MAPGLGMGMWRPKSTKGASLFWLGRSHAFELFGVVARWAGWQCRHCQRDCSDLRNVKGSYVQSVRLSRFSPEQRSGVRASLTIRTTRKPYKALRHHHRGSANHIKLSVDCRRPRSLAYYHDEGFSSRSLRRFSC